MIPFSLFDVWITVSNLSILFTIAISQPIVFSKLNEDKKYTINVIRNINDVKNYKIASVAVLLYPDINNITRLVLIKRSNYTGTHSGQIAFPGGKYEKSDNSYEETSRRETFEEIGVSESLYYKITNMSKIYIPSSFDDPSPSLPMYIPGRILMCSFQSKDLILSSVYWLLFII